MAPTHKPQRKRADRDIHFRRQRRRVGRADRPIENLVPHQTAEPVGTRRRQFHQLGFQLGSVDPHAQPL